MSQKSVWFPNEQELKNTRLYSWMQELGFDDYESFHTKTVDQVGWFWDQAVQKLGIEWETAYTSPLELTGGWKYPKWFVDGKMNIVHNAVEKWATNASTQNQSALIWESDEGDVISYSFKNLNERITAFSTGLEKMGLKRGDVVSIYMPMIPETVISMLAIAKLGAIFSPAFSGYAADAVATRVNAAQARYLITADGYSRRGKIVSMKEEADKAVSKCSSIEKVIVVKRTGQDIPWDDDRDIQWDTLICNENPSKTVSTNGTDPFMLIYTSGTTGKPKGAVHTHAGFPIKSAFDAGICMDVKQGDTLFWYTDMGWMMGPFLVFGGLVNGASILLFEGTPDYPNVDRIWEVTSKHKVTHLGISPTLIRSTMKHGTDWINNHDLSSLRLIGSTGEPWNPEPWMWLFENIGKKRIPIFNYSGGTEISGGILGNVLVKPISPITFNAALPGMDIAVYDQEGNSVIDEVGELVILKPWVGMTNGFWKENERYETAYWDRWPETWVHGDWVIKDQDGYWTITGRSDDILNVAGKRLGPAEMESILIQHPLVVESAAIGVPDEIKGEAAVCFAVLKDKNTDLSLVQKELMDLVSANLGKALKPKAILFVNELPKTRNGKVMRRVIRAAYLDESVGDVSSLENSQILEDIRALKTI
ncbi:AMP-binding protein [Peribacillus acanthi]|uniref:AMP-binding protein n=1 Tax=Peribacillus acanthi TaxID=2171554 RepID=UPI000D3E79FE|nr:AMP-binding protein [Peribacillus acanthi]